MLPSKGYFKALECPYFNGPSSCDRPYCHFKHCKQDVLLELDCQIAAETESNVVTASDTPTLTKLPEEQKFNQKVKSRVIEYVPQYIKSKNLDMVSKSRPEGSTAELNKKENHSLEYIPSRVDETDLDFEVENTKINNKDKSQREPINYTEGLSTTFSIDQQDTCTSEYIPTVIEKPADSKISRQEDKHHHDHKSSSKRKHESSRSSSKSSRNSSKSSRSSSKSSSRSKKSKQDNSPKHKREQLNKEKSEKKRSKDHNTNCIKQIKLDNLSNSNISCGPKSLREAVLDKVRKKLDAPDPMKTDLSCSSDEGKDPSITSVEADLIEFFGSEDSGCEQIEQKSFANVVEAKVKKRISHISTSSIFAQVNARTVVRPKSTKSLHEMVAERVQSSQNNNVPTLNIPNKTSLCVKSDPTLPVLMTKTRIAHQPKIESFVAECQTSNNSKANVKETVSNVKLNLRINSFKSSNNMPNPLRQNCLEKLYTAFINHYSSEEAIDKAFTTENEVHNKAKTSGIYRNLIVQSLMKANKSPELQVKSNPYYPSHMYGVCLYDLLKKYILTTDDLEKNGYPLMGDNKVAYISKNAYYYRPLSKKRNGDKFICMNCKSEFEINKRGIPIITLSKCIYHSGKLKFDRSKNEKFWLCCYQRQHESGCENSLYHVPDKFDDDALENFVMTKSTQSHNKTGKPNFYALDCEMVNTTVGIEIVRVTVINHEGEEVYESKVKPYNLILDYKSKYSGITEDSLKHCSKRLSDIQLDLLKIFNKDSILIGHSLESDLKALKMVHYNVVDTSIIYPHKYGPPYKWGLKYLCEQHLQRIIQSEEGHDSKEDALASLDLVWKKLKEDVKKYKPVNIISIDKK